MNSLFECEQSDVTSIFCVHFTNFVRISRNKRRASATNLERRCYSGDSQPFPLPDTIIDFLSRQSDKFHEKLHADTQTRVYHEHAFPYKMKKNEDKRKNRKYLSET